MDADTRHSMLRLQVAMWLDGKVGCLHCGRAYTSVDDFIARNPKAADPPFGEDGRLRAVDDACWAEWEAAHA